MTGSLTPIRLLGPLEVTGTTSRQPLSEGSRSVAVAAS